MKRAFVQSALVVGLLFLVYVLFSGSFWGGLIGLAPPLFINQPSYMRVIRDIDKGGLVIGTKRSVRYPHGIANKNQVDLPPRYQSVAQRVFAERKADGRLFVLFATWLGRGADLDGYLYCSKPLKPNDFFTSDWGPGGVHQQIHLCGISYLEPLHIRGQWYSVWRRLD